jgi:Uma2 family endonuclease
MMPPTTPTAQARVPDVFRFTVERYHQMIAEGILNEYDDVELIEGIIRSKMSKGDEHETVIELLTPVLVRTLPATVCSRCQCALVLSESEPEPDFAICTPARARNGRNPGAADTFLVMEVSDSALEFDRIDKGRVYAAAGIAVYWVVNVVDRQIEVYTDPVTPTGSQPHYRTRTIYTPNDQVPLVVNGAQVGTIAVADVLP